MGRRKWLAVVMTAAITINLVSCKDTGGKNTENKEDITITFATNVVGNKAEVLKSICREFEEKTGYTVEFQAPGSSYEELMRTRMSANEMPDVFTTHGWSVERYGAYLMPVNNMEWADDIDEAIRRVISDENGIIYALPIDMDIAGIICNMDVLRQAGVNADNIKTWNDFEEACEKIKATGNDPIHMGGKDNWTIGQYFDWVAPSFFITNGAESKAEELKNGIFDTAIWKQVAGMLDKWNKKGYFNKDVLTADYHADMKALAEGTAAFCFYPNSAVMDAKKINPEASIEMIPIPSASKEDEPSLIAGEDIAVGVWKDSKVKEAAMELLNYLSTPEVVKVIAETAGNKPGLTTVEADMGEFGKCLDKYRDVRTFPYFDREYLPSGLWEIMCSTGADILSGKEHAVENATLTMEQYFMDKFE